MNFKLKKLGKIPLPKGIASRYLDMINKRAIVIRQLSQQNISDVDKEELSSRLEKHVGIKTYEYDESSLLAYRRVSEHSDDWNLVRHNNRMVSPGFVHVVLSGSCDLRVGKSHQTFKRGDVFIMNPNVPHEVTSRTLCMTYCWTVPLYESIKSSVATVRARSQQ